MNTQYNHITELAKPFQDLRDDTGHAETVTEFAIKLCKILRANDRVVIPAAIMHDIGYYGMDKAKLKLMMEKKISQEEDQIKEEHMIKGGELAAEILRKTDYSEQFRSEIISIIRRHDSNQLCQTTEEKIVRDADKLWRYSKKGFSVDVRRRQCQPIDWYNKLLKNLDKQSYFKLSESKEIAKIELEQRKREFLAY